MWIDVQKPVKRVATKRRTRKGKDFLANTRLGKIEGFFKRRDIISGDKASAKQLKKDKLFKENQKKRKR